MNQPRLRAGRGGWRIMPGMRRPRLSSGEWRAIFRRQRASGLTVRAFCQRAGVALSTFSWWQRKLREQSGRIPRRPRPAFVEVQRTRACAGEAAEGMTGEASARRSGEPSGVELHLGRGRRIVVQAGFERCGSCWRHWRPRHDRPALAVATGSGLAGADLAVHRSHRHAPRV
jgi:hypothetical protein